MVQVSWTIWGTFLSTIYLFFLENLNSKVDPLCFMVCCIWALLECVSRLWKIWKIYVFFSRIEVFEMCEVFCPMVWGLWGIGVGMWVGGEGSVPRNEVSELFEIIVSLGVFLVAQTVKNLPAIQETQEWSLGWEDPLEKGMATHSGIPAWRIHMDRGACWATVHEVTKIRTWLTKTFTFTLGVFHSVMYWRWFYICNPKLEAFEFLWDVW